METARRAGVRVMAAITEPKTARFAAPEKKKEKS